MRPLEKQILDAVSAFYGVPVDEILGKSRKSEIAHARHVAWYVMWNVLGMGLNPIGRLFDANHTTVHHARKKMVSLVMYDHNLAQEIAQIKQGLEVPKGNDCWVITASDSGGHTVVEVWTDEASARSRRSQVTGWRKVDVFRSILR